MQLLFKLIFFALPALKADEGGAPGKKHPFRFCGFI
jgi:hypothetical protein